MILILLAITLRWNAMADTIHFNNSFVESTIVVKDTARINFVNLVPSGQVILVSIEGSALPEKNNFSIHMYDDQGAPVTTYGGWYQTNRMTYFVTSGKTRKYHLVVSPDRKIAGYIIRIKTDRVVSPFVTLDSKGNRTNLLTYMISNSPEEIKPGELSMGEQGYYLVRSQLQGNANIYWEHCNDKGYAIKYGVLFWNKDQKPLKVVLNSSSAKSWTECNGMEGAMCGVWQDWFLNRKNSNELNINGEVELPAYDTQNPSASAKWVFMNTVPPNEPVKSTFNGLLNVSITTDDGKIYSGDRLFCDMYVLSPGKEEVVLANVANNDIAPTDCTLRGSGVGAMLENTLPEIKISRDKPYRFLITGFDPPLYQKGENIVTTYFDKNGKDLHLPSCYGYSVVYRFKCPGFRSKERIKAGIRMHPNSYVDPWAGAYVIGRRKRDGIVFSKQLLITKNDLYVFDPDIPQNQEVTYDLVISGMSSLPVEVVFYND